MQSLRAQLILIRRQIVDDAPLLVVALGVALLFLLVLGLLTFIYPRSLSLHVAMLLIVLPVTVGIGAFVLGIVQRRGNEDEAIAAMLSVLCVTPGQLGRARIVTGLVLVAGAVLCLMPAISGAIVAGLVQWPESLSPEGLVDLSIALLLVGCASYCLGLLTGGDDGTLAKSLCLWPLALVLASLIIIKGLGRPLAIVCVPLIVAMLLRLLWSVSHPRFATLVLTLIVLMLVAIPLYWLRCLSDVTTALAMLEAQDEVATTLYTGFDSMRNFQLRGTFEVRRTMNSDDFPVDRGCIHFLLRPIGIVNYLQTREPGVAPIDLDHFGDYWGLYYDEEEGLFVERGASGTLYAGPEAVADRPMDSLGRFLSPVICGARQDELVVFDRQTRSFCEIRFDKQAARQGRPLTDTTFVPVDAITSRLGDGVDSVSFHYPGSRDKDALYTTGNSSVYMPAVDESGAIAVIDLRTRELFTDAGHLPRPRTLFGRGSSRPGALFDYDIEVIVKQPEGEYAGLIAASLSRQGVPLTVALFDKDGHLLWAHRGESAFSWAHFCSMKYPVESLHPPVLALASFFTAYSFDAGATHRALFLMPNSFVALQRDRETGMVFQFIWALVFLVPAMVFAGFLGWRVVRDARIIGVSRRMRWLWLTGTLALGLPAYITYRLTRPDVVLTPCRNCGHARRADMDRCHHCGRGWDTPELDPPAWRIAGQVMEEPVDAVR